MDSLELRQAVDAALHERENILQKMAEFEAVILRIRQLDVFIQQGKRLLGGKNDQKERSNV